MLHPSDEAFAFDERLTEACTGRPGHLPNGGHVPNVMGT